MSAPIRVLIVDDIPETRVNVRTLIELERDIVVAGEAANGSEAVAKASELRPDCILMDINMPVMDGIVATEQISVALPEVVIVMMSVQGEQEYLRKAMLAGARDYLIKPFSADDLVSTIRRACALEIERRRHQSASTNGQLKPGKVVSVFSTKGGVGKTTIAANLAVLLAKEGERVALIDLDLQFGDVAVLLDLVPAHTLAELAKEEEIDPELLLHYLEQHASGVALLAAPHRPEEAELVRPDLLHRTLEIVRGLYSYIVIDMSHGFSDMILAGLDQSDHTIFVVTADVPTVKNARLGLDVMNSLDFDSEKISLIINRHAENSTLSVKVVEENLGRDVAVKIPYDPGVVVPAMNEGRPFVLRHPDAHVTKALRETATLVGWTPQATVKEPKGLLRFLQRS